MKLYQNVGLALVTALATATLMTACGEETTADVGCSTDSDCATGEICHPGAMQCVKTCESGADCDDSAKNCASLSGVPSAEGSGRTEKICQCSTTQLCQGGNSGSSVICSTEHKICVTRCSDDAGCGDGQTCDTATGECKAKSTAMTCDTTKQQPDACPYGQMCNAGVCSALPAATCPNITNHSPALTFDAATGTGPVIYRYVDETTDDDAFCLAPAQAFTLTLSAYAKPGSTFPATYADLNGFFYVKVNGSEFDGTASMRPSSGYQRSTDGKHATFKLTLCGAASDTQVAAGFYFTGGNPFCAVVAQ